MSNPGQVARTTSLKAIFSLVFGVIGWMACPILGWSHLIIAFLMISAYAVAVLFFAGIAATGGH